MELLSFHVPQVRGNSPRYNKEDYETTKIGTSDCNTFMPFYAAFFSEVIEIGDKKIVEYSLPKAVDTLSSSNQYGQLFTNLTGAFRASKFRFSKDGETHYIHVSRGILFDVDDTVLMMLAVDTEYLTTTPPDEIRNRPDYSKFALFVTETFMTQDKYKNVRKKMETEYFAACRRRGVDIIQTNNVERWCFKNNFKKPKFRNVAEMQKHLKEEVPALLLTS